LAFCKPATHLNPLLINFWVLSALALFEPSKGAKQISRIEINKLTHTSLLILNNNNKKTKNINN